MLSNTIRTFLIAVFILFIVDYIVTRHLVYISSELKKLTTFEKPARKLSLAEPRKKKNELDIVVESINSLYTRLNLAWHNLQASETNYRQLLENSSRGVLILNHQKVLFHNKKLRQTFELRPSDDIILQKFIPYINTYEGVNELNEEEIYTLIANTPTRAFEMLRIKTSGESQVIKGIASAATWKHQLVTMLSFTDISHEKQLEKVIKAQQLSSIQADKMNTLGVMVSGITHQLNNPNQLIRLNSSVIANCWEEMTPMLDEYYSKHPESTLCNIPINEMRPLISESIIDTQKASDDIDNIIVELKAFIREDTETVVKTETIVDILKRVIQVVRHRVKEKNITLNFIHHNNNSKIECNKTLINQVFSNLIINAIEACEADKGIIDITLSNKSGFVVTKITDNGIGMEEKKIGRIFDLFYTSKNKQGGTGIGLAIVYSLLKDQNGTIDVLSEEGVGSTFTVSLPLSNHS